MPCLASRRFTCKELFMCRLPEGLKETACSDLYRALPKCLTLLPVSMQATARHAPAKLQPNKASVMLDSTTQALCLAAISWSAGGKTRKWPASFLGNRTVLNRMNGFSTGSGSPQIIGSESNVIWDDRR